LGHAAELRQQCVSENTGARGFRDCRLRGIVRDDVEADVGTQGSAEGDQS
jgi:hypothetical protein